MNISSTLGEDRDRAGTAPAKRRRTGGGPGRKATAVGATLLLAAGGLAIGGQAADAAARPSLTKISVTSGPTAGGATVTVYGKNLKGATKVVFGSTRAKFSVKSSTRISVKVPAHAAGAVSVRVATRSGGTSVPTSKARYTYVARPVLTGLSPTSGPTAGGNTVTLTGKNLKGTSKVVFGSTRAKFSVKSSTRITVKAPAHAAGAVSVRVTTRGGTSAATSKARYAYVPLPAVTGLSPASGVLTGGNTVTVSGKNLSGASKVVFGSTPGTSVHVVSSTKLTVKAPAHSLGVVSVRVTTKGGTSAAVTASRYTYTPVPKVVYAWGYNSNGQLGNLTNTNSSDPGQVSGLSGVKAVASRYYTGYALRTDGTVWAWGSNSSGQVGDGSTTDWLKPVKVHNLTGVKAISAGYFTAYAVKNDGTVWAWGNNGFGQVGDGTTTNRLEPVQVAGLSGIEAVASGGYNAYALRDDGTVWAWGYGPYGSNGDGSTATRLAPVRVGSLTSVKAIAAADYNGYALLTDGTVWAWGYGLYGSIGDGATTTRIFPVQITTLSGVTSLGAGSLTAYAVLADGTAQAWGDNDYGQVGDGTTTTRTSPVPVNGLTGVKKIVGGYHAVALRTDGTLRAWGMNVVGELGDGSTTQRLVPVEVGLDKPATDVAAGLYQSYAVVTP